MSAKARKRKRKIENKGSEQDKTIKYIRRILTSSEREVFLFIVVLFPSTDKHKFSRQQMVCRKIGQPNKEFAIEQMKRMVKNEIKKCQRICHQMSIKRKTNQNTFDFIHEFQMKSNDRVKEMYTN